MKKSANLMIAFLLITSLFVGVPTVGKADDSSPAPMGDWTITGVETINGYIHYQRGNITISGAGVLNIIDGGLVFQQDSGVDNIIGTSDDHVYTLNVDTGGTLNMVNSVLSTQLDMLYDYPQLDFSVDASTFTASGSALKFPGQFYATGSNVVISDSTITGFDSDDIAMWVDNDPAVVDGNDDGPVLLFDQTDVEIYDSTIDKLYENCYLPNLL
ncbi:MAG: hypothetical protein KAI64_05990, partial [Thermoplasmata archaeon]|nr:hypothetical protein [Thermoplasmata archaeon]